MILTPRIKELATRIDHADRSVRNLDEDISELVLLLEEAMQQPSVASMYQEYRGSGIDTVGSDQLASYPMGLDGYAEAFDPIWQDDDLVKTFFQYGVVVGKEVISAEVRDQTVERMFELMRLISQGTFDLADSATWDHIPLDESGIAVWSRGFFEIYHDAILAEIRQSVRLYIHHTLLWGTARLWTSFDRLGIKLPGNAESKGLPLHVDQNPTVHPYFKTTQGVLAIADNPLERGVFVGVPGSKALFHNYADMAKNKGEYVELDQTHPVAQELQQSAQPFPLRSRDIVTWDSRTTHANTDNISDKMRLVAYVSQGPAREDNSEALEARRAAFRSGVGSNNREALMHASKKLRYNNPELLQRLRKIERLTFLGKLLYGEESYASVKKAAAA
ncbi:phytanoyl-CoA dioxygenase family protein [Candidatus Woesebacteria bacterium]|nr:phytanoyl-CoA dioxygenase family protein [Candidatus Woesebacteria bacterium]